MELSPETSAMVPAAYFVVGAVKKIAGPVGENSVVFQRALPLLPVLVVFALSFIPGLGLAAAPLGTKILAAIMLGGTSGWAHKTIDQSVNGNV